MNHHYHLTGCCGIFLLLFLPHIAVADEVRLNNGDRLTGEIISMEKNLLILRSEFIQEKLSIELKDIACIISERKLPAVFQNEELVIGTLSCPENGMIAIESANLGKLPPLSLDRLQSINPSTYSGLFNLGGDLETKVATCRGSHYQSLSCHSRGNSAYR